MGKKAKSGKEYLREIENLKLRLAEAEDALRAIRNSEVDALVVPKPQGDEIFALNGADHLYRVFVDTMNEGAATLAPEGTILYCNNRFAGILDTSPEKVVGSSIYSFLPAEERSGFEYALTHSERKNSQREAFFRREDGRLVPVRVSLNATCGQEVATICMVAMDLTEQKRAAEKIGIYQRQLRGLASALALAEERERRRLAAELHDRIGQTLALTKIKLSGLVPTTTDPSSLLLSVAEIGNLIDTTIQDTHSLIFEISPPVLYQVGFEAAVEWLAEHFQEQYGLRIGLKIDQSPKELGEELRIVLFQVIRELLVNVIKHAKARRANISMKYEKQNFRIVVRDDGSGFIPDENPGTIRGFGLFNIQERLHHLGAEIEIESSPGKGTRVTLIIPPEIRGEPAKRVSNGDKSSSGG